MISLLLAAFALGARAETSQEPADFSELSPLIGTYYGTVTCKRTPIDQHFYLAIAKKKENDWIDLVAGIFRGPCCPAGFNVFKGKIIQDGNDFQLAGTAHIPPGTLTLKLEFPMAGTITRAEDRLAKADLTGNPGYTVWLKAAATLRYDWEEVFSTDLLAMVRMLRLPKPTSAHKVPGFGVLRINGVYQFANEVEACKALLKKTGYIKGFADGLEGTRP